MKRYRVLPFFDFDTRASILKIEIKEEWEEDTKKQHYQNKEKIINSLIRKYGENRSEIKINNYIDLGPKPFSIIAFHNAFFDQIRDSFIIEAYYPSLTGVCALGERILNRLMFTLRDDFKGTTQYKYVYKKESYDNWDIPIKTLSEWDVFNHETTKYFLKLKGIRNKSIHFDKETDKHARAMALNAIMYMNEIINNQFSSLSNNLPWFLYINSEIYIKKEWEIKPFIKRVYLPQCLLVGYEHELLSILPKLIIKDRKDYSTNQISDDEFTKLRENHLDMKNHPTK